MSGAALLEPSLLAALYAAADRVATDWASLRQDANSGEEVRRTARGIVEATVAAAADDHAPTQLLPHSPLTRRLANLVRGGFIAEAGSLTPPPTIGELLQTLAALDRVTLALEPGWDRQFVDRLSGPDGLELVVEVAHDLRSPLTSILFLAETLQRARSGPVTPLQERQLGLIYSAAFGLSSVASDVIELARGGDRLPDLDPLPFSVNDILESVRDIVQPIAEEKGLEIRLGSQTTAFRVGHPVAVSRVLLNLSTNALKFTDEGYVEVTAMDQTGTLVEFAVRDTGRGIPPDAMTMLFQPFRRRQRERDYAFSGSGLGLSICRKLVEAMQSELRVDTTQGQGTRFSFVLDLPLANLGPVPNATLEASVS